MPYGLLKRIIWEPPIRQGVDLQLRRLAEGIRILRMRMSTLLRIPGEFANFLQYGVLKRIVWESPIRKGVDLRFLQTSFLHDFPLVLQNRGLI